ncbi:unnamed protein product [Zymoseptoria tritici ST99CH_1A5]|uniref:Uncharacterized protein n=1 Tax=Zymoseptoria tritici ST99CH_1A5 TaxID=1276529 RepID=A0A1Y6LDB9_ZYMTR|nr:unnamed protein product [Zymoseptoria tritici ST99CH_1A5]
MRLAAKRSSKTKQIGDSNVTDINTAANQTHSMMASIVPPHEIGRLEPVEYDSYPSSDNSPPAAAKKMSKAPSTMPQSPRKDATRRTATDIFEDAQKKSAAETENVPPRSISPEMQKSLKKKAAIKYTGAELNSIGKQCSARLPPTSAVQAMFLYELQRKADDEKFFHSRMFQLRREEEAAALERTKSTQTIQALEARIKQLEKTSLSRDNEAEQRRAKSKSRLRSHQDALDKHMTSINDLCEKLTTLNTDMQALQTAVATQAAEAIPSSVITEHAAAIAEVHTTALNLFEDRDGMITLMTDTRARVTKLEDNVRALTLQNAAVKSPGSMAPHRLSMATSYGEKFDLAVPKGKAHVSLKSEGSARKANSAA